MTESAVVPRPGPQSILVVAGEVSGDMHAAGLVRELRAFRPDVRVFGIGGRHLRAEGAEILQDAGAMAVTGFAEVVRRLGFFRRVFNGLVETARARRPDLVLLVDYPGFNLRLARRLHGGGPRIVYYVCPQVWAWHRSRIRQMARTVDRLITIFPFEPAHFEGTGLRADYAGHPLADKAAPTGPAPGEPLPWRGEPRVALLPGSRANEVDRILPRMWRAAAMLQAELPGASFIIPCPSPEMEALVRGRIAALGAPAPSKWSVVAGRSLETLRQARAAAVASGTATVEAALMGCPMIVVYRTAPLTYALGRLLVRVPHIGMVNIIAGREICPEFIQHAADPGRMCGALKDFCEDTPLREAAVSGLKEVVERLGGPGARKRAAEIVAEELNMAAQKQTMSPGRSG